MMQLNALGLGRVLTRLENLSELESEVVAQRVGPLLDASLFPHV